MTGAIIFLGPTAPAEEAKRIFPEATYLPPAAQGDLYRAYRDHSPAIVGLIDGYFECVPSVWHKEILYLMAQGVHVLGSSSMGALRAAELDAFGMVGVGNVYKAFQSDTLQDDDEVAVLHGPPELGFPALSEAMVNIRQSFSDAREQDVMTDLEHDLLIRTAKNLSYKQRTYPAVLAISGMPASRIQTLTAWLITGRRNVKKEDALQLMNVVKEMKESCIAPKTVHYKFQSTSMWVNFVNSLDEPVKSDLSGLN